MKKSQFPNYSVTDIATFSRYQGCRKPGNFDDVASFIKFDCLSAAEKAAFKNLFVVDAETEVIDNPFDEFSQDLADLQYFILKLKTDLYFIDTQGFNYCRYVTRIVDMPATENEVVTDHAFTAELNGTPLIMQNVRVLVATIPAGKLYIEHLFHITVSAGKIDVELVDSYLCTDPTGIGSIDKLEKLENYLEIHLGRDIKSVFNDAADAALKLINACKFILSDNQ